jgi:hypothetical protein
MDRILAPTRCDPRAVRIAQVKFVALPMEPAMEPADALPPPGARNVIPFLRDLLTRVIGRLEAARP